MKKFDRYSIRGVIIVVISLAGIGYELFSSRSIEILIIGLYSFLLLIGVLLLFIIKDREV